MNDSFSCYQVSESDQGFEGRIIQKNLEDLPENGTLVKVLYSGLNYKDALSAGGNKGITRKYPHTPGIDAAGIIIHSELPDLKTGSEVIVTSYDLGMNTPGGFGQYISVPGDWVVPMPPKLTPRESMILGTAGLTAAQGIHAMIHNGQKPESGPILVTGARGAVGSMAVMILSKLGFEVIAGVSAPDNDTDFLKELGATSVVDSAITNDQSGRPLLKSRWAGAIDVVGGNTLATILKATSYGGNVVTVGNIGSHTLETTVFPFILNGIHLLGVGTQDTPMSLRKKLWSLLADEWKPAQMNLICTEIGLDRLDHYLSIMIRKKSRGRVLLNLSIT